MRYFVFLIGVVFSLNFTTALSQDYDLRDATIKGELETVKLLIDEGANVNAVGNYGWTAMLHASASGGRAEFFKPWITHGAR